MRGALNRGPLKMPMKEGLEPGVFPSSPRDDGHCIALVGRLGGVFALVGP